jgi:glycosyltransferase 2 family protein
MAAKKGNNKWIRWGTYAIKITLSVSAVYYLVNLAGNQSVWQAILMFGWSSFILCTALYLLSQLVSTIRLGVFFKLNGTNISLVHNFKLYLIGMSYNFFLPGGIGGDGYKYMVLKRQYDADGKATFGALLMERICGLLTIMILLCCVASYWHYLSWFNYYFVFLAIPIYILGYWGCARFFPALVSGYHRAMLLSVLVQGIQILAISFIAWRLHVYHTAPIVGIFLASTLATVVPIFLGGVGARELVFASFASSIGESSATLISIAIVFSVCTVFSAVPGLFLDWFGRSNKGKI